MTDRTTTTYTWGGLPVTLRVETHEWVALVNRYRSPSTGTERDVIVGSIEVRRGVIVSADGECPAPDDMLAEARDIYGPLPPAPRGAAKKARRTRRCSRCDRPAIGRASMGWACSDHYDALS